MLKIANWNLRRALPSQRRVSAIREHMAVVGADIWILTETHQAISPGDGFLSVTSGDPDRPSKPGERWVGIWSRSAVEPLSSFVSDAARCVAARTAHPDVGEIVIFGCVLPWVGSAWKEITSAGGAAFAAALDEYRRDWERLRLEFPRAVLVVAGDFNQSLVDWHYYGSKRQRGLLESVLAETGLTVATAGAADPIAREAAPYACIDHICITDSPTLRVGGTTRWPLTPKPGLQLSDHFGVAVELSRGEQSSVSDGAYEAVK
jgi:hypothetical protein